jgi:hypothetical protein
VADLEPLVNHSKHEININNIYKFASYLRKSHVCVTKINQLTQFSYCKNHVLQTNIALTIAVWDVTPYIPVDNVSKECATTIVKVYERSLLP